MKKKNSNAQVTPAAMVFEIILTNSNRPRLSLCQGLEVFKAFSRTKRASLAGELAVNRVNFSLSPRLPRVRRRK